MRTPYRLMFHGVLLFLLVAAALAARVGDPAPDFTLRKLDKTDAVHLASFSGKQPVVLIFGSYT